MGTDKDGGNQYGPKSAFAAGGEERFRENCRIHQVILASAVISSAAAACHTFLNPFAVGSTFAAFISCIVKSCACFK